MDVRTQMFVLLTFQFLTNKQDKKTKHTVVCITAHCKVFHKTTQSHKYTVTNKLKYRHVAAVQCVQ